MNPRLVNEAIVLYLGKGISPYPKTEKARLVEAYGSEIASEVEVRIKTILDASAKMKPDWSQEDLNTFLARITEATRVAFPELNENSLKALEWAQSYWWK